MISANVIVSNRQKDAIDNANIDAIKDLKGLFNVDDLINKFKNYVFSKMILDATSVINFASKEVLTKLVEEIGADRLIILLPSSPEPPVDFVKLLIELKIYNFTTDINDVVKFIENPNTYEDAIKKIDNSFSSDVYVDNSIKENEDNSEEEVQEINEPKNSGSSKSLGDMLNNFDLHDSNASDDEDDSPVEDFDNQEETSEEEKPEVYYDMNPQEDENESKESNEFSNKLFGDNTFLISDSFEDTSSYDEPEIKKQVIGFKNVTLHAGSTSLIYMLHKMLVINLKKDVLSIEIDKKDFKYYRDNKMISVERDKINDIIEKAREEVILVDLNEYDDTNICTDVIYLVEPSTIRLNELMSVNRNIFKELSDKKVVLNKSLLSESDIRTLSSEAGMDFYYNIEPLNDRILNDSIDKFAQRLNIK